MRLSFTFIATDIVVLNDIRILSAYALRLFVFVFFHSAN
jgi:hypothetical protein